MLYSKVADACMRVWGDIVANQEKLGRELGVYGWGGNDLKRDIDRICGIFIKYTIEDYKSGFSGGKEVYEGMFVIFSYLSQEYELGCDRSFAYRGVFLAANLISRYICMANEDFLECLCKGMRGMMAEATSISNEGISGVLIEEIISDKNVTKLFNKHLGQLLQTGLYEANMCLDCVYCVEICTGENQLGRLWRIESCEWMLCLEFADADIKFLYDSFSVTGDCFNSSFVSALVEYIRFIRENLNVNQLYFRMGYVSKDPKILVEKDDSRSLFFL